MMNQDCTFCNKEGILILPLRYAAVVGDHASEWLPEMPEGLGKNVTDLTLQKATYAPRMIRQGFIYVLINRAGKLYWEAYLTTDDGYLAKFSPDSPPKAPTRFTCKTCAHRTHASMIAVNMVNSVHKIYLLFSPTALSVKKMEEYQKDPDSRVAKGQLQAFDPRGWVAMNTKQEHSLKPEQLKAHVPEFLLHEQHETAVTSNRGRMLVDQLYPAMRDSYVGRASASPTAAPATRLGVLAQDIEKSKSPVFVLYDHIGITQELNNFRNAAGEPMRKFLEKVDDRKVSNQRKFNVMNAIEDTKAGYMSRSISTKERYIGWMRPRLEVDELIVERATLRAQGKIEEAESMEKVILKRLEKNANRAEVFANTDAQEDWEAYYGDLLDSDEMTKLKSKIHALSKEARTLVAARYKDHVKWVTSSRLVDAFEMYDDSNLGSGFCFSLEHMTCTDGMFGVVENVPLLREWMAGSEIERENLYMRSNFFNQENLQMQARIAFADAKKQVAAVSDMSHVSSVSWLKAAKGLVDTSKKIDSAWDEWLRDKAVQLNQKPVPDTKTPTDIGDLSRFHDTAEGKFYRKIAEWTQSISSKPGQMDKAISAIVSMLVFSKLGVLAEKIGIEEYLMTMTKARAEELIKQKASAKQKRVTAAAKHKEYLKSKAAIHKAASDLAFLEAKKMDDMAAGLLRDEQVKVQNRVKLTLDQLGNAERPATNNFRQARLGCLLLSIEALSLTLKLHDHRDSPRLTAEITASLLSVTSMTIDIIYSVTKSSREILEKGKMLGVSGALDVGRGGMKLVSGVASCVSGLITGTLDMISVSEEAEKTKPDWVLAAVYGGRGLVGLGSAASGMIAAYSYAGALFTRMSTATAARIGFFRVTYALSVGANVANAFVQTRTLWLIRLARLNMIGLGITALEIGYHCFIKDDELENWVQACCLRKNKRLGLLYETPFTDEKQELEQLEKAFEAILK